MNRRSHPLAATTRPSSARPAFARPGAASRRRSLAAALLLPLLVVLPLAGSLGCSPRTYLVFDREDLRRTPRPPAVGDLLADAARKAIDALALGALERERVVLEVLGGDEDLVPVIRHHADLRLRRLGCRVEHAGASAAGAPEPVLLRIVLEAGGTQLQRHGAAQGEWSLEARVALRSMIALPAREALLDRAEGVVSRQVEMRGGMVWLRSGS